MIEPGFSPAAPSKQISTLLGVLLLLVLTLVVLVPAMPTLYYTPDTDTSIFLYIGDKIRQGELPFRDWYDHKPPLIFYLNALGLWLGNGSRWGVWAVEFVSLSAASLLSFAALRRYFGVFAAVTATSATLLNLVFVHQRGNLTEEYALPFQFAVIFLLSTFDRAKKPGALLLLVGSMLAMASSLKQPLASLGLAVAVYLFIFYAAKREWRALIGAYLQVGLGFILVWAAWFAYFAAVGIFPEFWEAAFAYNFALAGIPLERRINALLSAVEMLFGWSGYFFAGMFAWLAVIPTLLIFDKRFRLWKKADSAAGSPLSFPLIIVLVDLPVSLVFSSLSGNNFAHYFMALLPSLTVLIAFLVYSILQLANRDMGKPMPYFLSLVILVPVFASAVMETESKLGPRGDTQIEEIVAYIEANTAPEDYVLQWGIVPSVHLLSGRDAPTRFFFPDPLFVDGYSGRAQTELLLNELKAKPPVLIVDEKIPRLPLLNAPPGQCESVRDPLLYERFVEEWKDQVEYVLPQMPEGMDEVYFWICQNYELKGPVGELGWDVYRLKGK